MESTSPASFFTQHLVVRAKGILSSYTQPKYSKLESSEAGAALEEDKEQQKRHRYEEQNEETTPTSSTMEEKYEANTQTIEDGKDDYLNIEEGVQHHPQVLLLHDVKAQKRVVRKVDVRLLPILGLLYTICLVDRTNIGVARIAGLDEDLGLDVGNRASLVLLIFFVSYILVEIPSNMIIKQVGPARWLSFIVFAWGVVSIGIGFLQSWKGLLALRIVLGTLEGGFFPGCVYLVGSWYLRREVQKRMAFFYLMAQGLNGFSNVLAYGIIQIANHTEYKGWRWIYIIEGTITCVAGLASYFVIVDFPDSTRNTFLTPEEKDMVTYRLEQEQGQGTSSPTNPSFNTSKKVTGQIIWESVTDWQVWAYAFMYMAGGIGNYALTFFLPIILQKSLHFSQELSFILVAPPILFAVVQVFAISCAADALQVRAPFVFFQGILAVTGLCMTGFLTDPWPRYAGTFLGHAGTIGFTVTTLAWQANNVRGEAKRAVSSAMMIMLSGVGGIYSSLVFRQRDSPAYVPGIVAVLASCALTMCLAVVTGGVLFWKNKKMNKNGGGDGFRFTI